MDDITNFVFKYNDVVYCKLSIEYRYYREFVIKYENETGIDRIASDRYRVGKYLHTELIVDIPDIGEKIKQIKG